MQFEDLYKKQQVFQSRVVDKVGYGKIKGELVIPQDIPELASYHIQALIAEVGEVLSADKRWKNFRKDSVNMENKKEEIADCFIVLMNVAMFSGIKAKDMAEAISHKMDKNFLRLDKE